jgi:hypothetical protein
MRIVVRQVSELIDETTYTFLTPLQRFGPYRMPRRLSQDTRSRRPTLVDDVILARTVIVQYISDAVAR